jgi:surfactin synthase thioesterase subunit
LYFSGFCLENDLELFQEYIEIGDFNIAGFSYGAIKAFEYAINEVQNNKRVQKLQLFSPAFFQDQNKKYKRLQLMFYKKDEVAYKNNFIQNIAKPSDINLEQYLTTGTYEQLDILLNYEWKTEDFELLSNAGVKIEVYLGSDDKIINSTNALEFFRQYTEVYFIKNVGHILK